MSLRERTRPGLGIIELPRPCLPGPGWLHEIKHDGFRILARVSPRGAGCASLDAALRYAARLRVVSPEHFPGFGVNEVHLRTDRAIHRYKHVIREQRLRVLQGQLPTTLAWAGQALYRESTRGERVRRKRMPMRWCRS